MTPPPSSSRPPESAPVSPGEVAAAQLTRRLEAQRFLSDLSDLSKLIVTGARARDTVASLCHFLLRSSNYEQLFLAMVDEEKGTLVGSFCTRSARYELDLAPDDLSSVAVRSFHEAIPMECGSGLELLGDAFELPADLEVSSFKTFPIVKRRGPTPGQIPLLDGLAALSGKARVEERRVDDGGESGSSEVLPGTSAEECEAGPHDTSPALGPALGVVAVGGSSGRDYLALQIFLRHVAILLENASLQRRLERDRLFRASITDSIGAGLMTVDRGHKITSLNASAAKMLGFDVGEVIGEPIESVWAPVGRQLNPFVETLRRGRGQHWRDLRLERSDGRRLELSVITSQLRDQSGVAVGVVAELTDTTQIRRMEDEIWQLEKLAAVGRLTTSVAHEIRNPLAGIVTGVQYLARSIPEADSRRESINYILNEIMRLDRIIVDLYSVSCPSSLLRESVEPRVVVDRSLRSLQDLSKRRSVRIEIQADEKVPPVHMDADKIQQVLINLFKNSFEASDPASLVTIRIQGVNRFDPGLETSAATHVLISVEDEGPGIAQDDLGKVFEPFYSRKPGGTGLGLYISYSIVERHGGDIQVESEFGRGTRVTVELPVDAAHVEEIV